MSGPNAQHYQDKINMQLMWMRFRKYFDERSREEFHMPPAAHNMVDNVLAGVCNANEVEIAAEEDYHTLVAFGDLMFHFGQFAAMNGLYRSNLEPCNCLEVTDEQIKAFFDGVNFGKGSKDA